jgi:hypothetical protein
MTFMTREERYKLLCQIKRDEKNSKILRGGLTAEEEAFVVEFATEKFNEVMRDPEVVAVMRRLKDR